MSRTIRLTVPGAGTFLAVDGLESKHVTAILRQHDAERGGERCLKLRFGTVVTRVSVSAMDELRDLVGGDDVVVKSVVIPWRRRLAYRIGVASKFAVSFKKLEQLDRLGVSSPSIVACSLYPRGGYEFMLTPFIAASQTVQQLLWLSDTPLASSQRSQLLESLGRWMRSLHDNGVWQRDFKPDNVVVKGNDPSVDRFYLLDTSDVRFFGRPLATGRRARNLSQVLDLPLAIETEAHERVLEAYGLPDGARRDDLRHEFAAALAERRRQRHAKTGFTYIDEEYHGTKGPEAI